jgi:hypothetical protein
MPSRTQTAPSCGHRNVVFASDLGRVRTRYRVPHNPTNGDTRMNTPREAAQAALLGRITRFPGTSFVELERVLDRLDYPYEGDRVLEVHGNIVLWSGWTDDAAELVLELARDGRVHFNPTSPLTYMADGKMLRLPIAKRPPKNGYKTPRWAPCTIEAGPPDRPTKRGR